MGKPTKSKKKMWLSNSYIKGITTRSMKIWKVTQNSLVIREMLTESVVAIVHLLTCLTFCDPMDCSMPGFPVLHHLPELSQTHVYWVNDAIQPSHPLLSPSPPAFNLSQHQGLFQWVSCSHQVAKGLEFQLQHQSFQWTFRTGLDWFAVKGLPWCLRQSRTCLNCDIPRVWSLDQEDSTGEGNGHPLQYSCLENSNG